MLFRSLCAVCFIGSVVNSIFIVGILTVIGYSVNDTIVIFDRIRENLTINKSMEFINVVNQSVRESITRSLGTSITTSIVIFSMILFGGQSLLGLHLLIELTDPEDFYHTHNNHLKCLKIKCMQ